MDLAIEQIRSLLAVVDYGGFHRAADALHLSQPAVSKHVRRVEEQVGGPFFERRGRGVELTGRGEAVVAEVRTVVSAHDRAVGRVTRETGPNRPFVLGAVEHLVDPMLPELLAVTREQVGDRPVSLRIDRSKTLVDRVADGGVDAALVMHTWDAPAALELGTIPLSWWAGAEVARQPLPDPVPVVAYDAPCGMRDMALASLDAEGHATVIAAESPHLSGIQSALRGGLGVALLAGGADGLREMQDAGLPTGLSAPLYLVSGPESRSLAEPLSRALWAATTRARRARPAA